MKKREQSLCITSVESTFMYSCRHLYIGSSSTLFSKSEQYLILSVLHDFDKLLSSFMASPWYSEIFRISSRHSTFATLSICFWRQSNTLLSSKEIWNINDFNDSRIFQKSQHSRKAKLTKDLLFLRPNEQYCSTSFPHSSGKRVNNAKFRDGNMCSCSIMYPQYTLLKISLLSRIQNKNFCSLQSSVFKSSGHAS